MMRNSFVPWWQTAFKMWELGVAVPQVMAHRTARIAAAGHMPSDCDRMEFMRMGQEKIEAFAESWSAMAMQMTTFNLQFSSLAARQWWGAWAALPQLMLAGSPDRMIKTQAALLRAMTSGAGNRQLSDSLSRIVAKGLAPVHRTATANVKRLRGS